MARYIEHTKSAELPIADAEAELLKSLQKLLAVYPPRAEYSHHDLHGLFSGPTSIALLLFYISQKKPDLKISDRRVDRLCHQYLNHAVPAGPVTPDRCGIGSETLAHLAVTAAVTRDKVAIQSFLSHVPGLLTSSPSPARAASNEWLYGRAGTLYLLRLISHYNPAHNHELQAAIDQLVDVTVSEGPYWTWHGKEYLGAVHGHVGIIAQLMLSSPKACKATKLWGWVSSLLDMQWDSGNFPSSVGSGRDELVQFCHGGPGFVIALTAVRKHAPSAELGKRIDDAVKAARKDIWRRGVLTKEPCLCHGVVGNAIAMDEERRGKMMQWAQASVLEKGLKGGAYNRSADPTGLFGGEAGRAWGWMIEAGLVEGMLGFSDV